MENTAAETPAAVTEAAPAAEATATTEAEAPATDTTATESTTDKTDWVKEARKWESRASENKEDAKRWKEYVEKVKPEQDTTAQKLQDTLKELEGLKLSILKENVVKEVGLRPEAMSRLQGTTEEELRKDAEELKALIGDNTTPSYRKPQPVTTQGVIPDSQQTRRANDIDEYEQILKSRFKK